MKRTFTLGLLVMLLLLGCVSQRPPDDACQLPSPPADAAVRSTHAGKLFTYPASIDDGYSGCRVTWLENGDRLVTARFVAGAVTSVEVTEPGGRTERCEFSKDGTLSRGESNRCLPRDAWAK